MKKMIFGVILLLFLISCSSGNKKSDAYGNFEAVETMISAEAGGKLLKFNIEEGMLLAKGDTAALIDTSINYLKKKQLTAMKEGISSKIKSVLSQIDIYEEQLETARKNKARIEKMFKEGAATEKQMDDINGQIDVIKKQIESIKTQNAGILAEIKSAEAQIEQIDEIIKKSIVVNPAAGTVLNKYAEQYEITGAGKPLYKIANIDYLILRAYVSGTQLPKIKLGQKAEVLIDKTKTENTKLQGEIIWISDKAEFTPKIIQTKEERVNLVYAVKIKVKNDGSLKIGMPGEVRF